MKRQTASITMHILTSFLKKYYPFTINVLYCYRDIKNNPLNRRNSTGCNMLGNALFFRGRWRPAVVFFRRLLLWPFFPLFVAVVVIIVVLRLLVFPLLIAWSVATITWLRSTLFIVAALFRFILATLLLWLLRTTCPGRLLFLWL